MPVVARTVGGPGAGKTTRMIGSDNVKGIMEMVLEQVVSDPYRIGFVSFTRAARREASLRAAAKFGVSAASLEKDGWFRTLHSIAYRCLGVGANELLTGSEDDNAWLRDVLGDDKARVANSSTDDDMFFMPSDTGDASRALAMWDAARNRLCTLHDIWEEATKSDDRTPHISTCEAVVTVYEAAKTEGGKMDFCDLLMSFCGKQWTGRHDNPFMDSTPMGSNPNLPVYFHDEMQDCSLLTSLVFKRLIQSSQFVYLCGDAFQAIYSFAGADGKIFADWPVVKEEILPISYRCPSNILACADNIMLRGGHAPRPFRSERGGGEVVRTDIRDALASIKPDQTTLVLARTNEYAKHAASIIDEAGLPWVPTKGGGGFNAPARADGIKAILTLRSGGGIDGEGVHRMMELFPVAADGAKLFERGAKSHYADKEQRKEAHKSVPLTLNDVADAGCTRAFKELIQNGKYVELLEPPAAKMARAAMVHGIDAVVNPKIRVGTMHSSKGSQASHVVLVNRIPYPVQKAIETDEGLQSEMRVMFVTASRASEKLTIAEPESGESFPDL